MRRVILALVGTVAGLVLLLSFKTHAPQVSTTASPSTTPPAAVSTPSTTASPSPSSTSSGSPSTKASTAAVSKTVTGDLVDTQWGPVQVRITVKNGTVTAARAVVYPQNNSRDQQINAYAVPTLNQEAVQAGNANIDMVSGATYTSTGYIQSLQSALDKANA